MDVTCLKKSLSKVTSAGMHFIFEQLFSLRPTLTSLRSLTNEGLSDHRSACGRILAAHLPRLRQLRVVGGNTFRGITGLYCVLLGARIIGWGSPGSLPLPARTSPALGGDLAPCAGIGQDP
jgi:hypothetical protein